MLKKVKKPNFKTTKSDLVIGLFENSKKRLASLDELLDGAIYKKIKDKQISGKEGKITTLTPTTLNMQNIFIVGLGKEQKVTDKVYANTFKLLIPKLSNKTVVCIDSLLVDKDNLEAATILAESLAKGFYEFNELKTRVKEKQIPEISYYSSVDVENEIDRGLVVGTAINNAKTMVNKPHSHFNSVHIAEYALNLSDALNIDTQVIEKDKLQELGMNAYLAVNKGSKIPPKFILMKYQGKEKWENPITIVGKGVMFDTGGYQLKPKASILNMKSDMGGAAAALGAIEAIAKLKLKQNVLVVIPSTDNMINEEAYLPDDVIHSAKGITIQITSTDAEGRLTLADALWYVQKFEGSKEIVDLATLTGAMVVALGSGYTGAFTNNKSYLNKFMKAANKAGEPVWHMPIGKHFHEGIKAKVADIDNVGLRYGGASSAAAFLENFIEEGTKWIHLDIAGTATDTKTFATGVMVKSLVQFVEDH